MLYCRFKRGEEEGWGVVEQHEVQEVLPDIFSPFERTGRSFALNDIRLLAPCLPSKIIAVGLNYKDHITEFGRTEIPTEPVLFMKPPSAVIGLDEEIRLPAASAHVDYEAELGIVISKPCHRIPEEQANEHILGCTCVNDVTARDLQKKDSQWTRAKGFDTFCPIGPWIADGLPFENLRVESYLNGKPAQQGHTSQMIFSVAKLVSYISNIMSLNPGDVIITGTPVGVGPLKDGDTIEIFVEGVGKLRNRVVKE